MLKRYALYSDDGAIRSVNTVEEVILPFMLEELSLSGIEISGANVDMSTHFIADGKTTKKVEMDTGISSNRILVGGDAVITNIPIDSTIKIWVGRMAATSSSLHSTFTVDDDLLEISFDQSGKYSIEIESSLVQHKNRIYYVEVI